MRIIFFGSDDFAQQNLEALFAAGKDVVACVTPPDKPKGRGMHVSALPCKVSAEQKKIPVLQPQDIKDPGFLQALKELEPDLFVVIAYGKFLTAEMLTIPHYFAINVHASLLPKYRGAAPINWAIIKGEQETGVTVIKLNDRMDAGDILAQARLLIDPDDTSIILRSRLAKLGSELLCQTVEQIASETHSFLHQDPQRVTFAPKLSRELGKIDWSLPAEGIHNLVRGLQPWPSAYTSYQGKRLKLLKTAILPESYSDNGGEIVQLNSDGFVVACGKGSLLVQQVHLESAKVMAAKSFVAGHLLDVGTKLGT